ncbi:MAG: exodeoxyribonuclease VII small subunit [Alphaproteobacteria bacterium]
MKTPLDELSFEAALQELSDITQAMEGGQLTLDQMMTAYQRGLSLKTLCENRLRSAEMEIEVLKKGEVS